MQKEVFEVVFSLLAKAYKGGGFSSFRRGKGGKANEDGSLVCEGRKEEELLLLLF
jgi:hypothetical protein